MSEVLSILQTPAPHTIVTTPALFLRLVETFDAQWITPDTLPAFLARGGDQVIFIAGDPIRFPECLDVAVILPELNKHFGQRFAIGMVERDSEDAISQRYGATRRPSLVFVRDGQYVSTIAGMLDWDVYLREVDRVIHAPVQRAPSIGIPVVTANPTSTCQ